MGIKQLLGMLLAMGIPVVVLLYIHRSRKQEEEALRGFDVKQDLARHPSLLPLIQYVEKRGIKLKVDPGLFGWEFQYDPRTNEKVIVMEVSSLVKAIVPFDEKTRKFYLAHELGHSEGVELSRGFPCVFPACKAKRSPRDSCLYEEHRAWTNGFRILHDLNLFSSEEEKKDFRLFAHRKLCSDCKGCIKRLRDSARELLRVKPEQ